MYAKMLFLRTCNVLLLQTLKNLTLLQRSTTSKHRFSPFYCYFYLIFCQIFFSKTKNFSSTKNSKIKYIFILQKEKCISKKLYAKKHAKNFLRNTSPEFLKTKVSQFLDMSNFSAHNSLALLSLTKQFCHQHTNMVFRIVLTIFLDCK